jgi:CHAT domain-containing protein
LREGADSGLLARERSVNQLITARLDEQTKLLRGKYTDEQRGAAERELDDLKDKYREVQAEIRKRSPHFAALTEPQPLTVKEIQQQVVDGNTILLEYALGDERSYLWEVTSDGVLSHQLPPKAKIEEQARRVYQLLTARQPAQGLTLPQQRAREQAADAEYQTEVNILSKMLLEPVAGRLGTKRLVIVADGALQYLPFAVLPAPETLATIRKSLPRPLIIDHEIVSLPSASVLAVLRRELAGRGRAARTVAVLADPVFELDDERVKLSLASTKSSGGKQAQQAQTPLNSPGTSSQLKRALRNVRGVDDGINLRRLLFSRDEAEAILSVMPEQSDLKALDFHANRKLAMSDDLSQYRVIHFSTHGLLDSRHPELSGLVLSLVDETGRPEEGFLRLHEIYNLKLNADLIVLSACQTGLGKEVRGEGLIGLTRGFMYAGAPRVMASLWQVDDAATATLMKRFYQNMLQEKLRPAAALRAAQIEMLKRRHWQSPYYWGAFVMQGEWR